MELPRRLQYMENRVLALTWQLEHVIPGVSEPSVTLRETPRLVGSKAKAFS